MRVILNNQNDGPYSGWVSYRFINATQKKKLLKKLESRLLALR